MFTDMSLKAFHVVFITLSILMAFGCGVWLLHDYADTRSVSELVVGIISLLGGLGLVAYGKSVLRKLKHISFL